MSLLHGCMFRLFSSSSGTVTICIFHEHHDTKLDWVANGETLGELWGNSHAWPAGVSFEGLSNILAVPCITKKWTGEKLMEPLFVCFYWSKYQQWSSCSNSWYISGRQQTFWQWYIGTCCLRVTWPEQLLVDIHSSYHWWHRLEDANLAKKQSENEDRELVCSYNIPGSFLNNVSNDSFP